MYIIRLDDASDYRNIKNWDKMEKILDNYNIKPIVGIIPKNEDDELRHYEKDENFWQRVKKWQEKGWIIALHGYEHKYVTKNPGINPIHNRSEFAGLPLEIQQKKIKEGFNILKEYGIIPQAFFAPSHTYDNNTLLALKSETDIRIISDTVANDIYYNDDFYFVPVQSGKMRKLYFKTTTFCLHPNVMSEKDFLILNNFIKKNKSKFIDMKLKKRKLSLYDKFLSKIYFFIKKNKKTR